jgi:HEAT repeat protein
VDLGGKIPVLVELRYWQGSIAQLILNSFARHELPLTAQQLETVLPQLLILFDGVNELPSEEARSQLSDFRRNHPKLLMIFTTRDLSLGGDLGIEQKLEMQPLTEGQMQAFIRAYVPEQAEEMLRQLGDRLREFGQTPLLLWMLCEVFQQTPNNQLPSNLAGVFQVFTNTYEISSVRKHEVALLKGDVKPLSDRRLWKKALKALASVMMQGETPVDFRVVIHRDEAERELSKIFPTEQFPVRDILDDLLKYHLLQNRNTDQIEFRHQLIQEYYAAEYLLRLLPEQSDEQLKRDYLNYLKWTEPIALMLALENKEAQALRVVKLAMDDVDLMVGARLAGDVKQDLQNQTVNIIDNLVIPLKFKIQLFGLTRSPAALPFLSQSLNNAETFIRSESIRALTKISGIDSIDLLRKALHEQDTKNCWMAACELANLGDETAIPALQEALYDEEYHINALFSIARLSPGKVITSLGRVFRNGSSEVRLKATASLHLLLSKGYDGILPLLETALHDEDSQVRRSAAHALKDADSEEAISILSQAWADEDMLVRNFVCIACDKYVEKYLEYSLNKALLGISSSLCKRAIEVIQMTKFGSKIIRESLLRVAFYNPDYLIRGSATTTLVMIGGSCVIKALGEILEKDEFEIRKYESSHSAAVTLLLQIRSIESIPILIEVLMDRDKSIVARSFAIKALGEIGDPSVIQTLLDNLRASVSLENLFFEWIYRETIFALGKLGVQNLEDEIISIIKNSDSSDTRKDGIEVLGKMLTEKARNNLIGTLTDPDFLVRFSSALILAKQKYIDSIPVLIEALGQRNSIGFEDSTVCQKATDALCEIGEEALEELEYALNHQDFQVKRNARRVISNINGEAARTDHPDIFVNQSPDNYVDTMINQLTSRYNFTELIHALSAASPDEAWQFSSALMKVSQPEQMDFLSKFMLESDSNNIFKYVPSLISFIQNRCKFYNYEIWRDAIQNEKLEIKNGEQETAVGQTTTIFNIETLNAPNAALNLGGTIHGDQSGTQNHKPNP